MCSTVGQGASDPLVRGMYYSILLMVSMPFAVVAAVGGWFVFRSRTGASDVPEEPPAGGGGKPRVIDIRRS